MAKRRIKGLKLRGNIWWWRGKVHGRRHWLSTGCRDFESAVRRALDMQRDLRDAAFGWRTAAPTWDDWLKVYLATYESRKAPTTQRRNAITLRHALPFLTGRKLDSFRQSDCQRYLKQRLATGVAATTVDRERRLLSAVFAKAVADGRLERNPWLGIARTPDVARHRILLPDAEAKLLAQLRPRYQRFVGFLLQTGLRLGEVLAIDLANHRHGRYLRVVGKGSKARDVPLTTLAQNLLAAQQEAEGKLWVSSANRYRDVLAWASRRAGIGHFSPHDMRHTFGHRWLQRGGDIYVLSRILGHSSVVVTERHYAYLLKEDLAAKMLAIMEGAATNAPPPAGP